MKRIRCETRTEIYAEELGHGYDLGRQSPYIDIAPKKIGKGGALDLEPRRVYFEKPLRVLGDGTAFRLGNLERGGQRHTWAEALSRGVQGVRVGRIPIEGASVTAKQRMSLAKL